MPVETSVSSPSYWNGMLAETIRGAALEISAGRPEEARKSLERCQAEYESSPVARPREVVGYALMTATGECMAIRYDYMEAITARDQALDYLLAAESCGHSRAVSWVAERLPIRTLIVDAEEVETIMEEGTPLLDREP
jgi:hypothetical protein